jgi:short-subunit dehydrogenase
MPRPVAVVTGASAGIGREIARVLAADFDLVLTARRESDLRDLAAELVPTTCHIVPTDLAAAGGPGALVAAVAAAGLTPEVLVNNAGFGDLGPFAAADQDKLLRMIQVNVTALTELTGRFLPGMLARGRGRILNVGSVAGFQPGPLMAVYYATKAYVNSFSEAIASEVAGTGVTVTCLCPGPTRSGFAAVAGMEATNLFTVGSVADAGAVAAAGVRAMLRGRPLVVTGFRNRLLLFAERFVPRSWVIRAVRWMQQKRRPARSVIRGGSRRQAE